MKVRGFLMGAILATLAGLWSGGGTVRAEQRAPNHHAHKPSLMRLHEASGEEFDYTFLSEMMEHHAGGIKMSEATLREAKRADVKKEARKVIAEQQKDMARMNGWTKAWAGKGPDPKLRQLVRKDMQPMMQAFQKECRQNCDRAFLKHMSMHHQEGIKMAEMAREKAVHPELKQLAEKMIRSQSEDIKKFQRMLAQQ